jgi:hypothetical protein
METNAILAINSLDRFTIPRAPGKIFNQVAYTLEALFENGQPTNSGNPSCNNFSITSAGALIYGYIRKLVVSDLQIQYNVPTICPNLNDQLVMLYNYLGESYSIFLTIPFGWYTPNELAGTLQLLIRSSNIGLIDSGFTVTYNGGAAGEGFIFTSSLPVIDMKISFPSGGQLATLAGLNPAINVINCLKMYRLLGITVSNNFIPGNTPVNIQTSTASVNFLYTQYIDIVSVELTKYQKIKDTDSSATKQSSMIARVYLAGQSGIQYLTNGLPTGTTDDILGSRPFTLTQATPNAKVIRWSADEAVNSLDFQLRDQYGDLLFCFYDSSPEFGEKVYSFNTEFQLTLLCVEKESDY